MKTTLALQGMHCQSCVKRLTEAFEKVPGVESAHVTLDPPQAHIESNGDPPTIESLGHAARLAGNYSVSAASPQAANTESSSAPGSGIADQDQSGEPRESLYPLILIVAFIAGTVTLTTLVRGDGSWHVWMLDFMAGFFLVFSFFKLLDLRGFVDAYQSYDLVAHRFRQWGFGYPFVELALGVAYLLRFQLTAINALTFIIMLIGAVGVLKALLDKRRIRCACLGTALNLPMTKVTLVEDLTMAAMAGIMFFNS